MWLAFLEGIPFGNHCQESGHWSLKVKGRFLQENVCIIYIYTYIDICIHMGAIDCFAASFQARRKGSKKEGQNLRGSPDFVTHIS